MVAPSRRSLCVTRLYGPHTEGGLLDPCHMGLAPPTDPVHRTWAGMGPGSYWHGLPEPWSYGLGFLRVSAVIGPVQLLESAPSSYGRGSPVEGVIEVVGEAVVHLQEARGVVLRAVGAVRARLERVLARQRVHGDLAQRGRAARAPAAAAAAHRGFVRRGLGGVRALAGRPPAVAEAGDARVGRGGRGGSHEGVARVQTDHLLVLLDVNADGQHGHHLGRDEGQRAEVEGPAIVVLALLVLALLVARVSGVAGDVNDDPDDVAQA